MPESPAWLLGRGYWSELYSVPPLQCDAGVSCLAARQRLGLSCIPSLLCSVMPESPAWLLGRGYWSELYSVPPLQCDAGVSCLAARQRLLVLAVLRPSSAV